MGIPGRVSEERAEGPWLVRFGELRDDDRDLLYVYGALEFAPSRPIALSAQRRGFVNGAGGATTGDDLFDEFFYVRASSPELMALVLDADARLRMVDFAEVHIGTTLSGSWEIGAHADGRLGRQGYESMFRLLVDAAERLRAAGLATPAFVRVERGSCEAWAAALGGEVVEGPLGALVRFGGRPIVFRACLDRTSAEAGFVALRPFEMEMTRQGALVPLLALLGIIEDVVVGDTAFDARFRITGRSEGDTRSLFDEGDIRRIIQDFSPFVVRIRADAEGSGFVRVVCEDGTVDQARLLDAVAVVLRLLDRLEALGIASKERSA